MPGSSPTLSELRELNHSRDMMPSWERKCLYSVAWRSASAGRAPGVHQHAPSLPGGDGVLSVLAVR